MTTSTTPRISRGRRVAAVAGAGLAATLGVAFLASAAPESSDVAGADTTTPVTVAMVTERATTTTTSAVIDPVEELADWFGALTPEDQAAFRLMAASDAERAAFAAWVTPAPAPAPEPPAAPTPEPPTSVPAPAPAPVPAPAPAPPARPMAPPCTSWATQEEATAWLQTNAASHDMSVIDSNGDGVPCTTRFAPPAAAPVVTGAPSGPANGFLACVMQRESRGNYSAVNSSSGAGGAYQFLQSTWNNTVRHAGRGDLAGRHPSQASPADQDAMALHLYQWQGRAPWAGGGC